ncbi:hypothetical protein Tco_0409161 [Tanacetum coccineum]
MKELRENIFVGNSNDDAHEHVRKVLDILSLFSIPGVTNDVVMLRGKIPRMTPTEALESILEMTDHSQKWRDRACNRRVSSSNLEGITSITNKPDNKGRDVKKLKESIHDIQDDKVPIILGRPMLATPHARMDVIGDLLELNDLLGENEIDLFRVLSYSDGEISIGLDDLLEELGNLLGNPTLEMANNEVSTSRQDEVSPENSSQHVVKLEILGNVFRW